MRARRLTPLLILLLLGCAAPAPPPPPAEPADWDALARAPRPFAWRLENGAWEACTVIVRATETLVEEDLDELEAVLTDWYNLARLGAFKDDPRQPGPAAAEAMGDPWQPAPDTLAATFHLGSMRRLGLVVLLNALEGYSGEQARLREVVLCAEQVPPVQPRRGTT